MSGSEMIDYGAVTDRQLSSMIPQHPSEGTEGEASLSLSCEHLPGGYEGEGQQLLQYVRDTPGEGTHLIAPKQSETLQLDTSQSPSLGLSSNESYHEKEQMEADTPDKGQSSTSDVIDRKAPDVEGKRETPINDVKAPVQESPIELLVMEQSRRRSFDCWNTVDLNDSLNCLSERDMNTVNDPILGEAVTFLSPIMPKRGSDEAEHSLRLVEHRTGPTGKSLDFQTNANGREIAIAQSMVLTWPKEDIELTASYRTHPGSETSNEEELILNDTETASSPNEEQSIVPEEDRTEQDHSNPPNEEQSIVLEEDRTEQDHSNPPNEEQSIVLEEDRTEQDHSDILDDEKSIVQEEDRAELDNSDVLDQETIVPEEERKDQDQSTVPDEEKTTVPEEDRIAEDHSNVLDEEEPIVPEDDTSIIDVEDSKCMDEREVISRFEPDAFDSASVSSWNETKSLDGLERLKLGGSPLPKTYPDLASAKKHLNDSSRAFTESLRDAAHRRKKKMTRSRDSLAAKEKQHLLSLASERTAAVPSESMERRLSTGSAPSRAAWSSDDTYKPFRARPAPRTTGDFGCGGQAGVPKVEKKPTTTPFSPMLGPRRRTTLSSAQGHSSQPTSKRIAAKGSHVSFKARPLPSTNGPAGHGGQAGVPKIPKRQPTVPSLPLLGFKRRPKEAARTVSDHTPVLRRPSMAATERSTKPTTRPNPKQHSNVEPFSRLLAGKEVCAFLVADLPRSCMSFPFTHTSLRFCRQASMAKERALQDKRRAKESKENRQRKFQSRPLPSMLTKTPIIARGGSPALRGLHLLSQQRGGSENTRHANAQTPRPSVHAYEPHSTIRAKKRAEFDQELVENESRRLREKQTRRRTLIQQTKSEVETLRSKLR